MSIVKSSLNHIAANVELLLGHTSYLSMLSGEDEVMLGTFLDFIDRLQEDYISRTEEVIITESPEQWREQQDAETD